MKSIHKLNRALFDSLNSNITDPFLVIDHNGDILSLNKKAETLFAITDQTKNISNVFDEQSIIKLNDLIEEVYENQKTLKENLHFVLRNKSEVNFQVIINSYNEENELFVFCTFIPQEYKIELKGISNFKIQIDDLKKIISNSLIIKIIEQIKSLYPFTFIGKERILKQVNEIDELFWIKDNNDLYALVNNKLSANLGLKPSQIEGKPVQSFLPAYQIDFYTAVNNYLKETLNGIMMEGVAFVGISDPDKYQTIEIPLSDADNNVIAVIGIAQRVEKKLIAPQETGLYDPSLNLLNNFDKAIAIVDKNGIIKHGSKEFCKLFSDEFLDLKNYPYSKVLPLRITEKIQQFLKSMREAEKFETAIESGSNKNSIGILSVTLAKIMGKEKEPEGFSVLIEQVVDDDNLEKIISKRGRMFEILIQNNPEPIFIYDTENLGFIEVNEAALSLYGYRKDEFLQMDLTDLYTPEDIQSLLNSSNAPSKTGKFTGPFKHKKKDGSSVYVEISKINFKYNDKDAHFNIIRDVTSRLELERKNQLFKTAFDNTEDLLFVTDNVGLISFVNPSTKKYLGYAKNEIENTSFTALVKDEERGTINSSIFQSHLKDVVTILTEVKNSNGEFVPVEITASPVFNYKDEVESFSIIGKIEKEPAKEPEEKIREVIKEVIIEKPSVSQAPEAESSDFNFLPSLFHELLTPINVILGFVQELTEGIEELSPEQKEATDIINQNRDRLLRIMNSVIEYSNIKKKNFELVPEEIGITEVIDQLHNDFKELSGSRDLEFAYGKISSSLKFESDKPRFQTLISILLKIAIQFNKEKKIYFSAYQSDDDYFIISIKDNYSSISKNMLNNLKTVFDKEGAALTKDYGIPKLTIQLALSLLDLLDGKFEVIEQGKDKLDCGFLFPISFSKIVEHKKEIEEAPKIELPKEEIPEQVSQENVEEEFVQVEHKLSDDIESLVEEENVEKSEEVQDEPVKVKPFRRTSEKISLSSLSCLYIEDQVDSQILFKVQMKELKDIKFAISFEEALPLLDSCHFDFIVMDINLQGEYNGLDALKIIHKMPGYENIPIIAVTAYVLPGDKEKFIATGFNDFISKPIFREKMIDALEKIFSFQL